MGTMNLILVIMFLCLLSFTITMIWLFTMFGSVPDTLITCVFAALAGECGIMGGLKPPRKGNGTGGGRSRTKRQAREAMEQAVQQQDDLPDNP